MICSTSILFGWMKKIVLVPDFILVLTPCAKCPRSFASAVDHGGLYEIMREDENPKIKELVERLESIER